MEKLIMENDTGVVLEPHEEQLKKVFEVYCSFGEPLNTRFLKSIKLIKMLKDAGLVHGQSTLNPSMKGKAC